MSFLKSNPAWIFGSFGADLLVLALPGLLFWVLVKSLSPLLPSWVTALGVGAAWVDAGHVYMTGWRFLGSRAVKERITQALWVSAIFIVCLSWLESGVPGFWSLVTYFTAYHHIRQFYGFSRWYERLSGAKSRFASNLLLGLTSLPWIGFHFRSDLDFGGFYTGQELFLLPNPLLLRACVVLWGAALLVYIGSLARVAKDGPLRVQGLIGVVAPALLQGLCFFFGRNMVEVLAPLQIAHGIAYNWVIGESTFRLGALRAGRKACHTVVWLAAAVLGTVTLFGENAVESFEYGVNDGRVETSPVLLALLATPLIWHYWVDGRIWRNRVPAMRAIVGFHGSQSSRSSPD